MKAPLLLVPAAVSAAAASTSYLQQMANSFIEYGITKSFNYERPVAYRGFEAAYELSHNETIATWYKNQLDGAVVLNDGTIKNWDYTFYSLDDYRIGSSFLWWYLRTKEAKYKSAADIIRQQLNRHPRTPSGGFWHRKPAYPNQMWLDGIFMAEPFYAQWTSLFDADNTTAWDDILLQFSNIEKHCRNHTTNLLVHGYDESKVAIWADPITGASPLVWTRAVGWYFWALLETIPLFPLSHPGHAKLVKYFKTLAAGLKTAQDESGGWWLVANEPYPGMKGNYIESSASAMFAFGWLQGMRLGLLDKAEYLDAAKKAYNLLTERFVVKNSNGTLNWEGTVRGAGLGSNATYEYYISNPLQTNDLKGVGPFMMAASEMELWASEA